MDSAHVSGRVVSALLVSEWESGHRVVLNNNKTVFPGSTGVAPFVPPHSPQDRSPISPHAETGATHSQLPSFQFPWLTYIGENDAQGGIEPGTYGLVVIENNALTTLPLT